MMFYLRCQGGWKEPAPEKVAPVDNKPVYQLYSAPIKSQAETIEYIKAKQAAAYNATPVEVVEDEVEERKKGYN
jgi:hypothetical protein